MSIHRKPRKVMGFTDIGPILIPPRPRKPALVDRSNGNTYEIVKSGALPALSVITDTSAHQVFAATQGPYIPDETGVRPRTRRLFSAGGTLSSEQVAFNATNAPVLVTVAASPLDVWEVVWDGAALALTERL